jgi:hypothetical protein
VKIVKVVPLPPGELAQAHERQKRMIVAMAAFETAKKEYAAILENLKSKYDPNYQANSKSQTTRYLAVIKDGCLVVTMD